MESEREVVRGKRKWIKIAYGSHRILKFFIIRLNVWRITSFFFSKCIYLKVKSETFQKCYIFSMDRNTLIKLITIHKAFHQNCVLVSGKG